MPAGTHRGRALLRHLPQRHDATSLGARIPPDARASSTAPESSTSTR